jgi:uncharacterized protein YfdQ (DUF2303 family)
MMTDTIDTDTGEVFSSPEPGTCGHGDWTLTLTSQPETCAQAWIDHLNREMPFQEFSDLIYLSGEIVVPKEAQPAALRTLAARCQLDLTDSLADLLVVANGVTFKGEYELDVQEDANNGAQVLTVADRGKASVRVPSAVIIAWEALPSFSIPLLIRIRHRKTPEGARFMLAPINLGAAQRQLALDIHGALVSNLEGKGAPVAMVPVLPI